MIFLGYKETAFSQAILAAGITHAVANACRRNKLPKLKCHAGDDPDGYDQNMSRSQRKKFEVRIRLSITVVKEGHLIRVIYG